MNDLPFRYYSYQMDSDEVKSFMNEHPNSFETRILLYLLDPSNNDEVQFDEGNVLMTCSVTDSYITSLTREKPFAILTDKMGLVYNPFSMYNSRVFLRPNLHHFADCFIASEKGTATEVSNIKNKSASTIGRAVAGGVIAGPTGAVIGAASAIDKNMQGGTKKVETREVHLYSFLLAGAYESEDQEYWSEVHKIYFPDNKFANLAAVFWSWEILNMAKVQGRSLALRQVDLSGYKIQWYNVYNFKDNLWKLITEVEGVDAEPHYRIAKNLTLDEAKDIVYEDLCSIIKENFVEKVKICRKEMREITTWYVGSFEGEISIDVHAPVEFVSRATGETVHDEFIICYKITGMYDIKSRRIERWPSESTKKILGEWYIDWYKDVFRHFFTLYFAVLGTAILGVLAIASSSDKQTLEPLIQAFMGLLIGALGGYFVDKKCGTGVKNKMLIYAIIATIIFLIFVLIDLIAY